MKFFTVVQKGEPCIGTLTAYNDEQVRVARHEHENFQEILDEAAKYYIDHSEMDEYNYDDDEDRGGRSYTDKRLEVAPKSIVVKDGRFYGYRTKAEKWTGNSAHESKSTENVLISIEDKYSTTVYDYYANTDSYDHTKEISEQLRLKEEVK